MVTRALSAYASIRKQFGTPIGKFEGIEEPLARIAGYNYLLEAMRRYTVGALDQGIKPPVDFGLSVSRIGNKGQWPAMRDVSKSLRLEYLQYQELLQMTQLRSGGLSKESEMRLKRD